MFVSDQPSVIRSLTATGRTNPGFGLLAVLQGSARSAEPICDCEIPARQIPIITTIRDLTGVDLKPTKEFPVDPANQSGFDNTGESSTMSPALFIMPR
jgi:hypothetical protein